MASITKLRVKTTSEAEMSSKKPRILHIVRVLIVVVLATFVVSFIAASFLFSPGLALRAIAWGDSDVYDYLKFPERTIERSETPFHFIDAYDEDRIRGLFESDPRIDDLGGFLESTRTQAFLVIQDDRILTHHHPGPPAYVLWAALCGKVSLWG
jgi:hypothetical protein